MARVSPKITSTSFVYFTSLIIVDMVSCIHVVTCFNVIKEIMSLSTEPWINALDKRPNTWCYLHVGILLKLNSIFENSRLL